MSFEHLQRQKFCKLSQCLTSHWEECLYSVGILLFCSHRVLCLLCLCCACMKSVWLHQMHGTSLPCCRIMWAPCPSFFFLMLDKSCSVRLSSHILCFTPLSTLVSLGWSLSHLLIFSLHLGVQNWMHYSRQSHKGQVEQNTNFFDLLAIFLLK